MYFSVSFYMIPRRNFVPSQVIPECAHSGFHFEWNSRSGMTFHSCKLKTNFVPRWNRKPCSLGRVAHEYRFCFDLAREPRAWERLRLSQSILSCEYSTNFLMERNSFRNETHSGIMWTAPKMLKPYSHRKFCFPLPNRPFFFLKNWKRIWFHCLLLYLGIKSLILALENQPL